MDTDSIVLISVLAIFIMLSACFSATETAFLSLNKVRLKNMAAHGDKKAIATLALAERYDRLLSTILIGNNIVNIAAASIATVVFTRAWGNVGVTISTAVMTVLILIFGEVTPKSLAKESPDTFAMMITPFIQTLAILLTPLNYLFGLWKKLLSRLFKRKAEPAITEEELLTIVTEAEQDGGINVHERDLIRSAIEFNDVSVDEILTPRVDVVAIEKNAAIEEIRDVFLSSGYSRLPVYDETIDHIIGILHEKDFYMALDCGVAALNAVWNEPVFISAHMKISDLLKMLQKFQTHMVIVVDDFGGIEGIVTMEDVIEELVGDIWDEHDEIVELIKKENDNEYIVSCTAKLDDLCKEIHRGIHGEDGREAPATVNGWILQEFGKIPQVGDTMQCEDFKITVLDADSNRVLKVKITLEPPFAEAI